MAARQITLVGFISLFCISSVYAQVFESGEQKNTLVELYTSEGCSSCPPADRWFSKLKANPDLWKTIIPVAFHVDYWDWIGWQDRFAQPKFAERQKRYKSFGKAQSVYTPGFYVNGAEWRRFFAKGQHTTLPDPRTKSGLLIGELDAGLFTMNYSAAPEQSKQLKSQGVKGYLAILTFGKSNEITSGENTGKTLHHDFIVSTLVEIPLEQTTASGNWQGQVSIPAQQDKGQTSTTQQAKQRAIALWVADQKNLNVLQAAGGWLDINSLSE